MKEYCVMLIIKQCKWNCVMLKTLLNERNTVLMLIIKQLNERILCYANN